MKLSQKIAIILWSSLIVVTLGLILSRPDLLQGDNLKAFIEKNADSLKAFYFGICLLRCFTLIPATPFILSGVLLFPHDLDFVLLVCMVSALIAATIHFYFSRFLEFDRLLEKRFGKYFLKAKNAMTKNGMLYVFLWSIAPIAPSEVIYYIAGLSGMKFAKFFLAVFLGEAVILWVYIYVGHEFFQSIL